MEDKSIGKYFAHQSKLLGAGKFGSVYIAKKEKSIFAVRKIEYASKGIDDETVQRFREEVKGLKTLQRHTNIVKYYDDVDDGQTLWLVMEYCNSELGDLEQYLMQHQKDPDLKTKLHLMLQCTRGLTFLHNQSPPIVHGDVKLKNFLVKLEQDKHVVKLTDYGFVKFLKTDFGQTAGSSFLTSFSGPSSSPPFCSPEQCDEDETLRYKTYVDIFSLGLVFQVLLDYPEFSKTFVPSTVGAESSMGFPMSVGMHICFAIKNKTAIPEIISIDYHDTTEVKKIKQLIIDMTDQDGNKRTELRLVQREVEGLLPPEYKVELSYDCEDGNEIDEQATQEATLKISHETEEQSNALCANDQENDVSARDQEKDVSTKDQKSTVSHKIQNDAVSDLPTQLSNLNISEEKLKISHETEDQSNAVSAKDQENDLSARDQENDVSAKDQKSTVSHKSQNDTVSDLPAQLSNLNISEVQVENASIVKESHEDVSVKPIKPAKPYKNENTVQKPEPDDTKCDDAVKAMLRTGIGPGVVSKRTSTFQQQQVKSKEPPAVQNPKHIPEPDDAKSDDAVKAMLRTGIGPGVVSKRTTTFQEQQVKSKDPPAESNPPIQDQEDAMAAILRTGYGQGTKQNIKNLMEMWNKKE